MAVAGCARDDRAALHERLDQWFEVERSLYFKSKARCTVAMFQVDNAAPREGFAVASNPALAKAQFRGGRQAAVQMNAYSPHDLTETLLLSGDGVFGKEVLAAAAQAGPCFKGTEAERALLKAMTRRGAILAYDRDTEGMVVLDPDVMVVFYVAGDVW
ncbi:MAG: hypothetical protein AAFY31_04305 [Pseudomonadota bacterium]